MYRDNDNDNDHPVVGIFLVCIGLAFGAACLKYLITDQDIIIEGVEIKKEITQKTDCGWVSLGCESLDKGDEINAR